MLYRTPGVYVEEISKFPPSVAGVETAIPAFIGYTQFDTFRGENLRDKAIRITSLLEYEERFGFGPQVTVSSVSLDASNNVIASNVTSTYYLYDSLRLFFNNGGGDCYIISIGNYSNPASVLLADLQRGLERVLYKTDEPTLIVFPDGIVLGKANLASLYQLALNQCNELKDRFLIADVHLIDPTNDTVDFTNDIDTFRSSIGSRYLNYAAAYYPYISTNIGRDINYRSIRGVVNKLGTVVNWPDFIDPTDTETLDLFNALDQIVNDLTIHLEPDIRTYLATQQVAFPTATISNLEDVYLTLENALQSALNAPVPDILVVRPAFIAIMTFIYQIADVFIDDYADDTTPTPLLNQDIIASVRNLADDLVVVSPTPAVSPSLDTLAKLDNAAAAGLPADAIFGAPTTFPLYDDAPLAWQYSALAGVFIATNNDFSTILPLLPNQPTATTSPQRIANMGALSPVLRQIFYNVYSAITQIYDEAHSMEREMQTGLLLQIPVLKNLIEKLKSDQFFLPPSGAIAGIYASVDLDRGVFKAPANIGLNSVIKPLTVITISDNDRLNVDLTAGKSINAIKSFVGKGTYVWGARTLAGNDNEWRYIPVRRFFIFAEESIKKATFQFVFEPNDANTWTKVKAMILNFLTDQWRTGALAGAKPDQAFFVKIGLGETMTAVDILEGRMIVEIGMAVVRPAEFIILRFSHKMQEA